jgi:hypothetical protein
VDIADHSEACLASDGPTAESEALAARINEPKFNYLSAVDRRLLQDAIAFRCDSFLAMERRLPRNGAHLRRELGLLILTPSGARRLQPSWRIASGTLS